MGGIVTGELGVRFLRPRAFDRAGQMVVPALADLSALALVGYVSLSSGRGSAS